MSIPDISDLNFDEIPPSIDELIDTIASEYETAKYQNKDTSYRQFLIRIPTEYRLRLLRELSLIEHKIDSAETKTPVQTRLGHGDEEITQLFSNLTKKSKTDMPERIGNYLPQYSLGTGGTGEVFAAIDTVSGRYVALKLAHEFITAPEDIQRFLREAKNADLLQHPNVVSCIGAGQDGARPYLVFEFLNGLDLRELLRSHYKLSLNQKLWLIADICLALQHAHDRLIVHRDIKPSNIMVVLENETEAGRLDERNRLRVKVLDFGLAKLGDMTTRFTQSGALLGTPFYMSPEQAAGLSKLVDHRSDIYSTGVVFYELLTGHLPFHDREQSVVNLIRSNEVPLLCKTNTEIPDPVAIICQRCLRLHPNRRYSRVGEVAADIERYLTGQQVQAKPISHLEHFCSYWQRKQLTRPVLAACLAMVLTISLAATFFWLRPVPESLPVSPRSQKFVNALPNSLKDESLLSTVLSEAKMEDLVYLKKALKNRFGEFVLALNNLKNTRLGFYSGESEESDIREQNAQLILCSMDPDEVKDTTDFRAIASHLTEKLEVERLSPPDNWLEMLTPIADEVGSELEALHAQTRLATKRKNLCQLLSILYQKNDRKLLNLVDMANSYELPILSRALGTLNHDPSELISVDFSPFQNQTSFVPEEETVSVSNRVIVRYLLGDQEIFCKSLEDRPDPRIRTNVIHRLAASEASIAPVIELMIREPKPDVLYALTIFTALTDFDLVHEKLRLKVRNWIVQTYKTHPDPGVHAMCGILLEQWGLTREQFRIDQESQAVAEQTDKSWFVDAFGLHFALIDAPSNVTIGRKGKPNSLEPVELQTVPMGYRYAFSMDTIPLELLGRTQIKFEDNGVELITYDETIQVCNWLNAQCGYDPIPKELEYDAQFNPINIEKWRGYRLPTSAEWEIACRGFCRTQQFHGTVETPFYEYYIPQRNNNNVLISNRFGISKIFTTSSFIMTKPVNAPRNFLVRGARRKSSEDSKDLSQGQFSPAKGYRDSIRLVLNR